LRWEEKVEVSLAGVGGGFVGDARIRTTGAVRQDTGTYPGSYQE
jgi:hypothetical protein